MSDGLFAKKEKRFDSVTTNYSLLILIWAYLWSP